VEHAPNSLVMLLTSRVLWTNYAPRSSTP